MKNRFDELKYKNSKFSRVIVHPNTKISKHLDRQFYLELYPDLKTKGIESESDALNHYIHHGYSEGRIRNRKMMQHIRGNVLESIKTQFNQAIIIKSKEEKINILIRTSNRPECFKKCIQSILEQDYVNYHIFICYDKEESLDYLKQYSDYSNITYFPVNVKSSEKYKFNLYCNLLMDKVYDGWIMFLDDDDMLSNSKAFSVINDHLNDTEKMYIWKFFRPDRIICPYDLNDIKLGETVSCGFTFYHTHKSMSKWSDQQYGDFNFVSQFNISKSFINYICTQTICDDIIGNFGN